MSKPWGGIGAWAAEAERAEAEELAAAANSQVAGAGDSQNFPSLKEVTAAAAAKPKKKKAMTLSEFTTGTYVGPGRATQQHQRDLLVESKGLTPEEMFMLPTGPKERSAEEIEHGRFNRGFQSYGTPTARNQERRNYGGFDDERRPPPRVSDFDQPSRADEVDNWAMAKRSLPPPDSGRNDRYGSLGRGSGIGGSRADEVDNWAIGKKPLAARSGSFGSGARDSVQDSDRWGRGEGGGGPRDGDRGRPRLVLDPPRGEGAPSEPSKTSRPSPFGVARPREDVLAEKGLDWRMQEQELESRKYAGSQSSRPSSAQSSRSESPAPQVVIGVRSKVNPFGDAKPREVLLQEQGKDWRKMDFELEHRAVDRPETMEETKLKEEIQHVKEEIEKEKATVNANGKSLDESGGQKTSLHELLLTRERDLELLICELDDKVRFGQRLTERPGSRAGRTISFTERPSSRSSSRSGVAEEPRNRDFMDTPRSRGTGDTWNRSTDNRRTSQGDGERGFLGSGEVDRSKPKEGW